jgi:hypothetical protein
LNMEKGLQGLVFPTSYPTRREDKISYGNVSKNMIGSCPLS